MESDKIFKTKFDRSSDFKFDKAVANVFDDMVVRSVPFYLEMHRMMSEIARDYAKPDTSLYDLGCSTGTTFRSLHPLIDQTIKFVGIDNSEQMLDKCRSNLVSGGVDRPFELHTADLNQKITIENASVVVCCLTLQFVRPIHRQRLINSVFEQMNPGGCFLLIEKILGETTEFNRQFIKYYYDMKRRNDYDETEIVQKREALENVLVPYKLSEDIQMLSDAGFTTIENFFKWYNFAGIVAIK